MTGINAISKVRFSSARPQRVHLDQGDGLVSELLCMESGQKMTVGEPSATLYVILGTASVDGPDGAATLQTGHLLTTRGCCTLTNAGEHRLVCLATRAGN